MSFHVCIVTSIALAMCLSGCRNASSLPTENGPGNDNDIVSVKTVVAERVILKRTTTQPAIVHANHQAEVHAKVAGYLSKLKVDMGDRVAAGDVLGEISVPEMVKGRERQAATMQRLQADEASSQAQIELALASVRAAEASRDQAKADVAKADAQLTADKSEFDRVQELVSNKSVAAKLLDEARNRLGSSQAAKQSSQAAIVSASANVSVARARLAAARADFETARAETAVAGKRLEEMDAMMAYATLKAPFAGVVTHRNVDPGDLVRNTQTSSDNGKAPLFTIVQLDKVRIRVALPENDAPWADQGDPATLTFRSLPGRSFDGKVSRVSASIDESTRTMTIEIDLPNDDGTLMPGMYGEATVVLHEKPDCLVLPARAVRHDEHGNSSVYVIAGDSVRVQRVTTGMDDGNHIEILSGLDGSESIAEGGIGRLQESQRVKTAK